MNVNWSEWRGLTVPALGKRVRAIVCQKDQITTGKEIIDIDIANGLAVANPERDLAKLAVIERHRATGNVGIGFVRGFGLKRGAIATSVAHDAHNLIAIGVSDDDMELAIRKVSGMEGGIAVVIDGKVRASLPLPVGGLMSDRPLDEVARHLKELLRSAAETGCEITDPITALSFLALPVIPSLKLTDTGLVDVDTFEKVSLFADV
jgi:adenine deaminase